MKSKNVDKISSAKIDKNSQSIDDVKKWFSGSLFNLLVDYYPEVPYRPYGSGATRENVLSMLKELQLGCIIIYAKGHSGYTTFQSSLRTAHPMLAKDMPEFFRGVTRETGTRLFLYYSGMLDGIAGLRHPEWRMKHKDGRDQQSFSDFDFISYGNCPLSPYFDEWVAVHLKEMITRYDPDGIWVDGDWAGPCYCPRCEARFRKETGYTGPMPDHNLDSPEATAWTKVWAGITHEWRTKFNAFIKSLKPSCMYSAGNVSSRTEYMAPFDWCSGDWFSPNNHRISMTMVARRYTTLNIPFDAYTCDTCFVHSRADLRARTKTLPRMLQEGATLLANGSQWGYWTYPMPNGAFIPSKIRLMKKAKEFALERKDICLHSEAVPCTGLLFAEPGAYLYPGNVSRTLGTFKAMIALHHSPVWLDERQLSGNMPYDLIVVPENSVIESEDKVAKHLENFVRQGGKLLTTGATIRSKAMQKLIGVRLIRENEINDGHVIRKNNDPAGVYSGWDKLELREAKELYPLYLSWDHFNPETRRMRPNWPITGMLDEENPEKAGLPAATVRRLGKGLAVHISTGFFQVYWTYGNPDMLAWLKEILDYLQPDPLFRTDALSFVEISLRRQRSTLLIHFINGNPGRDISLVGSDDYWVDDIPSVGPVTGWIKCPHRPNKVTLEPGGKIMKTDWQNGTLKFILPRLEIHSCVKIENWE